MKEIQFDECLSCSEESCEGCELVSMEMSEAYNDTPEIPQTHQIPLRNMEWSQFSNTVADHIMNYTVPQYGDKPNDQLESFTPSDIKIQLIRYINRIGSNSRGETEAIRDCLKIAHYACVLHSKLTDKE